MNSGRNFRGSIVRPLCRRVREKTGMLYLSLSSYFLGRCLQGQQAHPVDKGGEGYLEHCLTVE